MFMCRTYSTLLYLKLHTTTDSFKYVHISFHCGNSSMCLSPIKTSHCLDSHCTYKPHHSQLEAQKRACESLTRGFECQTKGAQLSLSACNVRTIPMFQGCTSSLYLCGVGCVLICWLLNFLIRPLIINSWVDGRRQSTCLIEFQVMLRHDFFK